MQPQDQASAVAQGSRRVFGYNLLARLSVLRG